MVDIEPRPVTGNHVPRDPFPHLPVPRQPHGHEYQDLRVPLAAPNVHFEGHMARDQPVGDIAGPGRLRDLHHHADVAHDRIVDYPALPLRDPYIFPDVGLVQGILEQGRPNAPENQEHDLFGYAPQHIPPLFAEAAFPDLFAHRIPAPGQPAAENLRQLAIHYLHHPESQVGRVSVEPSAAGLCKVVIVLELADIF